MGWRWCTNGAFSVKSTYKVLNDGGLRDACALKIWNLRVPAKVQIFVWLALKKRLLTTDNLAKRGWSGSELCVLCGSENETVDHILLNCVYTRFVAWWVLGVMDHEGAGDDVRSVWEKGMLRGSPGAVNVRLASVATLWWVVWDIRNKTIFQQVNTDPLLAIDRVRSFVKLWEGLGGLHGRHARHPDPPDPAG